MTVQSTPAVDIVGRRSERLDSDHTSEDMSFIQSPGVIGTSFVDVAGDGSPIVATATVHVNGYHFGRSMEPVTEENELQKAESDIPLLPGEERFTIHDGQYKLPLFGGGYAMVTNYRIISVAEEPNNSLPRILVFPLQELEQVDLGANVITLSMKGGRVHKLAFSSDTDTQRFHKVVFACFCRLNRKFSAIYGAPNISPEYAAPLIPDDFEAFAWKFSEAVDRELPSWLKRADSVANEITHIDFNRLGMSDCFKISNVNEDFKVCPTYPEKIIVPKEISDDDIRKGAPYRSISRFPAVVWRCRTTRAVLLRSSQPQVGILSWRNPMDEKIIEESVKAGRIEGEDNKQFVIMDARGYTSAFANRARCGGFENSEYYQQAKMEFLGLPNIHSVRNSFQNIRTMLHNPGPPEQLLQSLQTTMWLNNISNLLTAALNCSEYLQKGHSVLVHCSDGWDRTTQVTSLAKIMLDEHYRTVDGFEQLIRRDWVAFGHKLHDRQCPSLNWNDERCPIFLQFLEAVRHLQREQPTSFEFSHTYLIKLAKHAYSGLFGTFLFNSHKERNEAMAKKNGTLVEIWRYIGKHNHIYVNQMYDPATVGPLKPTNLTVINLRVWHEVFADEGENYTFQLIYKNKEEEAPRPSSGCATPMTMSTSGTLTKSKRSESINSLSMDDKPKENGSCSSSPTDTINTSITASFHQPAFATLVCGLQSIDTDGLIKYQDDEQEVLRKMRTDKDRAIEERDAALKKLSRMAGSDERRKERFNSLCDLDTESETGLERAISDLSMVEPDNELPNFKINKTWETKATNCRVCDKLFNPISVYNEERQHHCRHCGRIVCEGCSKQRYSTVDEGQNVQKRVCDSCYTSMQEPRITRTSSLSEISFDSPSSSPSSSSLNMLSSMSPTMPQPIPISCKSSSNSISSPGPSSGEFSRHGSSQAVKG
uniref:phosphatidylinositol-3,5-bisphosphate 3-phosphatase n=1 Tax=Caenorhabditis japonica TaxID=281687 RepID=A0A8R1I2E3_CAEJA